MTDYKSRGARLYFDHLSKHSALSKNDLQILLELPSELIRINQNRDIISVGQVSLYTHIVVTGMLASYSQNPDGTRHISAVHVPGDMPGMVAMLHLRALSGLQALPASEVVRIPTKSLRAAALQSSMLAEAILRDAAVHLATTERWLTVGKQDAAVRIAHMLCELAIRLGAADAPVLSYPLFMTQSHIGEATGLTSVHVNRVLKRMREGKLIDFIDKQVVIYEWEMLVRLAGFNGDYLLLKADA